MKFKNYLENIYKVIITDDINEFINEIYILKFNEATLTTDSNTDFNVPKINKEKYKKSNAKKNRKKIKFYKTNIKPEDRSFKNLPRYANKKAICKFQDWLCIDGKGSKKMHGNMKSPNYYGKAANGKWYGWSHRAVYGFEPGMKIEKGHIAIDKNRTLPYKIKDEADARKHAIIFAKAVS